MRPALLALAAIAVGLPAFAEEPAPQAVLTAEQQAALTPERVLEELREGNERFVEGTLTTRDHSAQVREAAEGQFPKAMVLSCVDSRIPVEDVFDRGIGDVFVARVAGNFDNTDILGSMEFATEISGAKLILVLGHEECGAIKAAIDGAELGNITSMLTNIQPAVDALADYPGERSSANPEFVHDVAVKNVRLTMQHIRERSPVIRALEAQGKVDIVGGMYEMRTGAVEFLD